MPLQSIRDLPRFNPKTRKAYTMAITQVAQVGTKFAVQEDGNIIPGLSFDTRGQALAAAISYKENN